MLNNAIKPTQIRTSSGGRLFSTTSTQAFKSIGASANMRTFATAAKEFMVSAPESSLSMTAKQFQRQMTNTPAQAFKTS